VPRLLGTCEIQRRVRVERLLARLLQLVEVAGLQHAPGQLRARFCGLHDLHAVAHRFLGRDRLHPGLARLRREREHVQRRRTLHLRVAARFDLTQQRQCEQAREIEVQPAFPLDLVPAAQAADAEAGVGQAARLHQIRLADAELEERRLQAAVVQERKLHRIVHRERLREQLVDTPVDRGAVGVAARPAQLLGEMRPGGLLDRAEAAVRRERGAAGQQHGGAGREQRRAEGADRHRAPLQCRCAGNVGAEAAGSGPLASRA
jgi:hypothetical protein